MQDFKKLEVWHLADSIPTNISEGVAKKAKESARYLDIALASANELENHLLRARDGRLLPIGRANRLIESTDHVRRTLIRPRRKEVVHYP